jgi:hypothetical protein
MLISEVNIFGVLNEEADILEFTFCSFEFLLYVPYVHMHVNMYIQVKDRCTYYHTRVWHHMYLDVYEDVYPSLQLHTNDPHIGNLRKRILSNLSFQNWLLHF